MSSWRSMMKMAESGSGSISQTHGPRIRILIQKKSSRGSMYCDRIPIGIQAFDVQRKKLIKKRSIFWPKIAIYLFLDLYIRLSRPENASSPPERTSSQLKHEISSFCFLFCGSSSEFETLHKPVLWIRIQWGPWICIRIRISISDLDPDPEGQKLTTKIENS